MSILTNKVLIYNRKMYYLAMSNFCTKNGKDGAHPLKQWNIVNENLYGPLRKSSEEGSKKVTQVYTRIVKQKTNRVTNLKDNFIPKLIPHERKPIHNLKNDIENNSRQETSIKTHMQNKGDHSVDYPSIPIQLLENDVNFKEPFDNHQRIQSSELAMHILPNKTSIERDVLTEPSNIESILKFPFGKHEPPINENSALPDYMYDIKQPSVTHVLTKTRSAKDVYILEQWKKNQIAIMGLENFEIEQKKTMKNGEDMHAVLQHYLQGNKVEDLMMSEDVERYWKSVSTVLKDFKQTHLVEQKVVHPHLHYKGILDGLVTYKNKLSIVDWKLSKKQKPYLTRTFDAPIQVAAYIGALNFDNSQTFDIANGVIVVVYEDGSPAHALPMTHARCLSYWDTWLSRLHQYWNSVLS